MEHVFLEIWLKYDGILSAMLWYYYWKGTSQMLHYIDNNTWHLYRLWNCEICMVHEMSCRLYQCPHAMVFFYQLIFSTATILFYQFCTVHGFSYCTWKFFIQCHNYYPDKDPVNSIYSISQEICTRFCFVLLCCGYAIVHNEFTWSIYPYSSGLLCWHWGNH